MKRRTNTLRICLICVLMVLTCAIMTDVGFRRERWKLQARAKQFLAHPCPGVLETNFLGGYMESHGGNVLIRPRKLIERYATNGRIRLSALIQREFATAPFGLEACEDVAKTNQQAKEYLEECKAILDQEWRMGYLQWFEDTAELKQRIPEIEEEDAPRVHLR